MLEANLFFPMASGFQPRQFTLGMIAAIIILLLWTMGADILRDGAKRDSKGRYVSNKKTQYTNILKIAILLVLLYLLFEFGF